MTRYDPFGIETPLRSSVRISSHLVMRTNSFQAPPSVTFTAEAAFYFRIADCNFLRTPEPLIDRVNSPPNVMRFEADRTFLFFSNSPRSPPVEQFPGGKSPQYIQMVHPPVTGLFLFPSESPLRRKHLEKNHITHPLFLHHVVLFSFFRVAGSFPSPPREVVYREGSFFSPIEFTQRSSNCFFP